MQDIALDTLGMKEKTTDGSPEKSRPREARPKATLGWRHFQVFLQFLGLTLAFSLRTNLSVAIVAMVSNEGDFETFDWDSKVQSYVLSSFFWGYVCTQVPAGQAARRWGAHRLVTIAIFFSGLVTILNPLAARFGGWPILCACRVIMGLLQGFIFSCMHTLLSKWAPPCERARLGTCVYAGCHFGTVVALPLSGQLAASHYGWPSVFYFFGGIAVLWSIVWSFFGSDSPAEDQRISSDEREYIESSLKTDHDRKASSVPWKAILTSNQIWAVIIANSSQIWGFWILVSGIPTYFSNVLGFSLKTNGLLSALPFLTLWILSFPTSIAADWLLERGYITVGMSRKICNTIGTWIPTATLIIFSYIEKDRQWLAVCILVITVGFNVGTLCGYQINHIDLSPNFAGTLLGLSTAFATVWSILAPILTGIVVTDATDIEQWRTVFFVTSATYFFGNLYFVLYGSASEQWWNNSASPDSCRGNENEKSKVAESA